MRSLVVFLLILLTLIVVGCGRKQPSVNVGGSSVGVSPVQLTDETFQSEVIENELPVLVDMWAPWCQPCIAMKPTIRELALELSGEVKVVELNIEQNPFVKEKYNVDQYPMLLIFVDGEEVERLVGMANRKEVLAALFPYKSEAE